MQWAALNSISRIEGSRLAQSDWELWGQCRSHLRVSVSRVKEPGHLFLCTQWSQVKVSPGDLNSQAPQVLLWVGKVDSQSKGSSPTK